MKRLLRNAWRVAMVALMAYALPAPAAVDIDDQVERYAIDGSTPADLRREMRAKGPRGADGKPFDGYTRWYVSWRYRYNTAGGSCAIDAVTTSVKVTMTLPQWRNPGAANTAAQQQWSRYVAALELHEQGHRRHGVDAAHEVDRAIAAMPPAGSCDALGAKANALGTSILRKYNQLDLDYDRDTRHGATQGARFP